ncbi:MAG: hypothetical protein JKY03_06125 [Aureispira sp.]|nr:hypothetical protein [Aureispira sp.]
MKIGILGLGAIGSVLAAHLKKKEGVKFYYYNRSPRKAIELQYEEDVIYQSITCQTKLEKKIGLDWLIICLKEHQYTNIEIWLSKLTTPLTKVVVLRNGINLKKSIDNYCQDNPILEAIIDCPTQALGVGRYQQLKRAKITVSDSDLGLEFATLFETKGLVVQPCSDFKTESWKKVCESASLGAILCLSGTTCWIFKDPKIRQIYLELLNESILVARADGAQISALFKPQMLEKIDQYPMSKSSSMLSDRLSGQRIELGAKNGIISNLSKVYKIATPLNDWACTLLKYTNVNSSEPNNKL